MLISQHLSNWDTIIRLVYDFCPNLALIQSDGDHENMITAMRR